MNQSKGEIPKDFVQGGFNVETMEPTAGNAGALNTVIQSKSKSSILLWYPVKRVDNVFSFLSTKICCIEMDLTKAYYQLPISFEKRSNAAFITPRG